MSAGKIRLCSFGILLLALCWNFFRVYQLAVDVPVGDDWDLLKNVTSRQWNDLAEVHVQHRIIFTRLLLHLAWVWDALDYRSLIFCNYFIYVVFVGAMLFLFWDECRKFPWFPLFFLPFFSDFPHENLLWAGQNQFHFMLLFGTLAIWAGFNAVPGWQSSLILAVALLLSIFSMSPLLADVIWGIWIFRECLLHYRQGGTIRREWLIRCTAVSVLVAAGNLLFFAGYTPADCGAVPAAGKLIFYACSSFVRGIALLQPELPGWGIALQVVLFLVPGLGGLYVLCRKRVAFLLENGKCAVWLGWCMVFCAAIAGARGGAVDYRHLEALLPLTPAVASLLLMIPEERMRRIVLLEYLAAVLICLSFFVKSSRPELLAEERRAGAAAVRQFTGEAGTSLDIPALYPQDLAKHWQMARERNITLFR